MKVHRPGREFQLCGVATPAGVAMTVDKEGIVEIVNLQTRGGHAKAYQVRQVRQVFVAEAPELPGCMAHGNSQETALRNIKPVGRMDPPERSLLARTISMPGAACRSSTTRFSRS